MTGSIRVLCVILLYCLISMYVQSLSIGEQGTTWTEDDRWDGDGGLEAFKPFYPHLREFSSRLLDEFGATPEQKAEALGPLSDEPITPDEDCALCKATYLTIDLIVNVLERDIENATDRIIAVCIPLLTNQEGLRGDIMCPGVVNTYAPSIWYIWQHNTLNVHEVCEMYNQCDPGQRVIDPPDIPWPFESKGGIISRAEKKEKAMERARNIPRLHGRTRGDLSNTIKVAQVADIHVEAHYEEGSAGHWGNFGCNVPERTTEALLEYLNELKPDILVNAGDNCPHTVWDETLEKQLDVSRYVGRVINSTLPDVPTYSTVGNHETYPTSFLYPPNENGKAILREWGKVFGPLAGFQDEQYQTLHDAGYYTILTKLPKLRILGYNSNYGYNANGYNLLNKDSDHYARMKTFMEDTLQTARENGEKVILIGHHPTGQQSSHVHHAHWIIPLQIEYSDIIVLHPLGHHHDDDFRLIVDPDSGRAVGCQHSGPTLNTRNIHNPAMRMIYLDKDTYLPVDMDVYLLDVTEALQTKARKPPIRHQYRFTEEYDVDDMTVSSLEILGCRMENDTDLVKRFYFNMKNEARNDCESASCQRRVRCTVWQSNWHDNNYCREADEYPKSCSIWIEKTTAEPDRGTTTTQYPGDINHSETLHPIHVYTFITVIMGFMWNQSSLV